MNLLTALSHFPVGNHHKKVQPNRTNEERYQMFRAVWRAQLGNSYFNYGVNAQRRRLISEAPDGRKLAGLVEPDTSHSCRRSVPATPPLIPRSSVMTLSPNQSGGIPGFFLKHASVFGVKA